MTSESSSEDEETGFGATTAGSICMDLVARAANASRPPDEGAETGRSATSGLVGIGKKLSVTVLGDTPNNACAASSRSIAADEESAEDKVIAYDFKSSLLLL